RDVDEDNSYGSPARVCEVISERNMGWPCREIRMNCLHRHLVPPVPRPSAWSASSGARGLHVRQTVAEQHYAKTDHPERQQVVVDGRDGGHHAGDVAEHADE